jgi:hypothetical protein
MDLELLAVSHSKQEMAQLSERDRTLLLGTLCWVCAFILCTLFGLFSAIPGALTYLLIGKTISANSFLESTLLFLLRGSVSLGSALASVKLIRNKMRIRKTVTLSLIISLLIMLSLTASFSAVFMPQVSQADRKIGMFVAENKGLSFPNYVANVTSFLDNNVGDAWDRPEATFAINRLICYTCLDPYIMRIWGIKEVDLIVYQGWGSCGEAAILIEELLYRAGYETRLAYFKGIDHEWAEAKYNRTWWIVDPWYIGNLVEAKNLKDLKPAFQQATGVDVQYENGTVVDASLEHGY